MPLITTFGKSLTKMESLIFSSTNGDENSDPTQTMLGSHQDQMRVNMKPLHEITEIENYRVREVLEREANKKIILVAN